LTKPRASRRCLEGHAGAGESPVGERARPPDGNLSTPGHAESGRKPGRPRSKAKDAARPIVDQYREGKVKSTPARGMKETLKPHARTPSELGRLSDGVLFVERAGELLLGGEAKGYIPGAGAKASPKRAAVAGSRPETG